MPTDLPLPRSARDRGLVAVLGALVLLVLGLTVYQLVIGDDRTFPVGTVAQLAPLPVTVAQVPVGPADSLAVQANGYLVTQTRDVGGPQPWPWAAAVWVALLGVSLSVWLAVVSSLTRPAFIGGMAAVIFLLMSLNADSLEVFDPGSRTFLLLCLVVLGGAAFVFHAFLEQVQLGLRLVVFGVLVAGLGAFLYLKAPYTGEYISLHLAAYGTQAGAAAVALLALVVGGELIYGLLWFNTQGDTPQSRYGLLPFVLASVLLLSTLLLYYLNNYQLQILPGRVFLEPFVLLLLAAAVGWWSLPAREKAYDDWLPYQAAAPMYLALLLLALASVGYAAGTANSPWLAGTRAFVALALLCVGAAVFLYVLFNFLPLIRQRLRVYQVMYDPRRLPYYAAYLIGVAALVAVLFRNGFDIVDWAKAGQYVQLGDLALLQSRAEPDNQQLPLLTERYYAEADQLDPRNARAALSRATLYQDLLQLQNEIRILRLTLNREPNEKALLRLAARFSQPSDFLEQREILNQGLRAFPRSVWLNGALAQLYSRSALTDSVAYYYRRAVSLAPNDAVVQTNWLAFLLKNGQLAGAQELVAEQNLSGWPAWQSNVYLLELLSQKPVAEAAPATAQAADPVLTVAEFARLYHLGLQGAARRDTSMLPLLRTLQQLPANEPFTEQLLFLQGLTRLRDGQPAAGFDQFENLASGDNATYYQQLLGLYLLERGLYASAAARFGAALQADSAAAAQVPGGRPDPARLARQQATARRLATASRDSAASAPAPVFRPFARQYAQAATLPAAEAEETYRRLLNVDPFDEAGVLQAADFLVKQGRNLAAYEGLRRAVVYNPESVTLLRRYALAAADAGLPDYANNSIKKLSSLLPSTEFATFKSQFDKRRAAHRAAAAPWD